MLTHELWRLRDGVDIVGVLQWLAEGPDMANKARWFFLLLVVI